MSTTGLNATLYSRIRDYAEMLDDVLILLKSGTVTAEDADMRRLTSLVQGLAAMSSPNLEVQLLRAVFQGSGASPQQWDRLSKELLAGKATPNLIAQLEILAQTLENERAGTLAKMRGG